MPGRQADLINPNPKQPRLMGYFDVQREFDQSSVLHVNQNLFTWIAIRQIRPSDLTDVLTQLTEHEDHDGCRWNVQYPLTAWLGNISISQTGASAWVTLIMLKSEFAKLKFTLKSLLTP